MTNEADLRAEKLWLIEHLVKSRDKPLLHQIKTLIENHISQYQKEALEPMSLEEFHARMEKSEKAYQRGDVTTQDQLREEIKRWTPLSACQERAAVK